MHLIRLALNISLGVLYMYFDQDYMSCAAFIFGFLACNNLRDYMDACKAKPCLRK